MRGTTHSPQRFLVIFLFLLLVACSRNGPDNDRSPTPAPSPLSTSASTQSSDRINLTLAVDEADLAGYRPLIDQFHAQHDDVRVNLVAVAEVVDSDEPDPIAALAAAADVFPFFPDRQHGQQYLLDLQPLLNADPTFDRDDFLAGLLPDDGTVWSLPVAASYPLVFFDKPAFDAAGLTHFEPGWTLDDFLDAAQTLTQKDGNGVTRWGYVPLRVQPLLAAHLNAPLLNPNGAPRLTDSDVVAAVQWLADLYTVHRAAPWPQAAGGPDPLALVNDGQAAMWSGDHVLWQFEGDDGLGVTTMPRDAEGYAADATRYAFAVSRGTAQPQAAWELLAFLSRQPPVSGTLDLLVPARRSVAAAADFWNSLPAELAAPLRFAAENNAVPYLTPATSAALLEALTAVITEDQMVAAALEQAQAVAVGQAVVAETDAEPVVVATPPSEASAGNGVTEIIFAATWNETPALQELAKAFSEDHPHIRVTVRRIDPGNDYFAEIAGADCFAGFAEVNSRIGAYVRPLNALFELDRELSPDDFFFGTTTGLTQRGQLLGMPGWIRVPLIAYNRDLFAAAGVAEPSPDWTLDKFLDIAQALTDPATGQYGFIDWDQGAVRNAFVQFGVEPIEDSGDVADIDYAAIAPMVRWYVDLTRLYGVHPILPGDLIPWQDYFDRHDRFVEMATTDRVAMWPHTVSDLRLAEQLDAADVQVGVVPLPRGPSGYSFSVPDSLVSYFIAADSPQPDICWEWLKFLVTQPTASRSLPAHVATAQSGAFADHVGAERAAAWLVAIGGGSDQAVWAGKMRDWVDWGAPGAIWLTAAIERSAKGETDVDSALADAAGKFARYRACVIDEQAFDSFNAWRDCALEADPELSRRYD